MSEHVGAASCPMRSALTRAVTRRGYPCSGPSAVRRLTWRLGALGAIVGPTTIARTQTLADTRVDTVTRRIDGAVPPGRIVHTLVAPADTSQRYALYLPSSYTRDRRWPVLFLLDPRGVLRERRDSPG